MSRPTFPQSGQVGDLLPIRIENIGIMVDPDCGSDTNLISKSDLQELEDRLGRRLPLRRCTKRYKAVNEIPLNFDGTIHVKISNLQDKSIKTVFHVLSDKNNNEPPLLGEKDLFQLGLISYSPHGGFVRTVSKNIALPKVNVKDPQFAQQINALNQKFRHLFDGLGCLRNYEVDLRLSKDAQPFYHRASPVPIHLRSAATSRISDYVSMGIFEPLETGTPVRYVSSLIVVEKPMKKEGKIRVRLCGNYVHLNRYLERSVYMPSPRVEDFLEKMRGAKFYAVMDLKDGYSQLKLSEKSKQFCVLSTHVGMMTMKRLGMGLKVSQDYFDAAINGVLANCQHVVVVRDDVLIGCKDKITLLKEVEKVYQAFSDHAQWFDLLYDLLLHFTDNVRKSYLVTLLDGTFILLCKHFLMLSIISRL